MPKGLSVVDEMIAFWRARLGEDEAAAKDWQPHERYPDDPSEMGTRWYLVPTYTPARVLREVEADRKLLAEYEASVRSVGVGLSGCLHRAVLARVAVWDGHPDYRPGWAA